MQYRKSSGRFTPRPYCDKASGYEKRLVFAQKSIARKSLHSLSPPPTALTTTGMSRMRL